MLLLLSLCSNDYKSTSAYSSGSLEEDAKLALELDVPEIFDKVHTSNGWSMQSFTAELCLELARRLDQISSMRNALIQRGIQLSFVADGRIRGEQNKIKHLAAYEAHRAVYSDLLKLAERDAAVSAGCVYMTLKATRTRKAFLMCRKGRPPMGTAASKEIFQKDWRNPLLMVMIRRVLRTEMHPLDRPREEKGEDQWSLLFING